MPSTSCEELAREVLEQCLAGNPPERLPTALTEEPCTKALFGVLVEGLSDRFDPALCDVYARLLGDAVPGADPEWYKRVRVPRRIGMEPERVVVLSRVTLGADVAVTSVLLNAAKLRFPAAQIIFAGPRKNFELFADDPRLVHAAIEYPRGTMAERLSVWGDVKALATSRTVVIDADSRLTQLGLLPVGEEARYHLFESRAYGGDTNVSLPELTARWAEMTFGNAGVPYVAPAGKIPKLPGRYIAVSLGVGENQSKRIPDPFEKELLALLAERAPLVIDKGAGGEESDRVMRAAPEGATFWGGSFAGFAKIISKSELYVGYDSAGQHVAAASDVPLISIFAGFPSLRMFERWKPKGEVIRVDNPDPAAVLEQVRARLK